MVSKQCGTSQPLLLISITFPMPFMPIKHPPALVAYQVANSHATLVYTDLPFWDAVFRCCFRPATGNGDFGLLFMSFFNSLG